MNDQLKKMYFDVDASQIDIKPLLEKEFLELSMKAISTANPNRNGSWFTKESLINSKHTFTNKPILGYFENEDFVSHDGQWDYDPETNMDYFNTLGKKGERILGIIRESDEIKIVEDKNGLYWICFTCALWTQYSYKQIKRLIKDAEKAKKTGKSAKNISVEIDVTDYEQLENGVMKINSFNLIGVTILGSRNGVKVEPGIEDAELSVIDVMGRELYEKQANSLRLAYEKLEDKKEVSSKVTLENDTQEQQLEAQQQESQEQESVTETTSDSENEVPKDQDEANTSQNEDSPEEIHENFEEDCSQHEENEENCSQDADTEQNNESNEQEQEAEHCENENTSEENESKSETECFEQTQCEDNCNCNEQDHEDDEEEEEDDDDDESEHQEENNQELCKYEAVIQEMSSKVSELENEVKTLSEEKAKLMERVASYEKEEFIKSAKEIINKTNLSDDKKQVYVSKCQSSEIDSIDSLKTKIALELFEEIMKNSKESQETETFSMNVEVPNVTSFADKKESKKETKDCWDSIKNYNTER